MTKPKMKPPDHQAPQGELRVLRKLSNYEFAVELWVMRDGVNETIEFMIVPAVIVPPSGV